LVLSTLTEAGWPSGATAFWRIATQNSQSFGVVAPVGNEATWLTEQNTQNARDLPVLYSIAATEAENGRRTAALARDLRRNSPYKECPDTEHATVWYAALPVVFDLFDKQRGAAMQGRPE
jgi:hypothetical protein